MPRHAAANAASGASNEANGALASADAPEANSASHAFAASADAPAVEHPPGAQRQARVLIVEDEPRLAGVLRRALSSHDFAVECTHDGEAALHALEHHSYELVILDLRLPGIDGFAVLRRALELRPDQEVLVLSALNDVEAKVRCLEGGASDYVTKPVALPELVARVHARVRHSSAAAAEHRYLEIGRLFLDLQRHVALHDGRPVPLSTREYLLLRYLMQNDGTVCTRQQLLADVWGYNFDPGTNIVEVYVRRLRTKLGRELIETVRNVGYCIADPGRQWMISVATLLLAGDPA
jgi:DNA-binding response OmpR family regulator